MRAPTRPTASELRMVYSIGGGAERVYRSARWTADIARIGSRMLAAGPKVKPCDVIATYPGDRLGARNVRRWRSEISASKDRSRGYSLAQSRPWPRRPIADRRADRAQKEIISATWNLEGGPAGGRPRHQGLPTRRRNEGARRADAGATAGRPSGACSSEDRAPPGVRASAADDPVRAAVAAMARALQQRQTQKTAGASPTRCGAQRVLLRSPK